MDNSWKPMSMCRCACVWDVLHIKDMQFSTLKCVLFAQFWKSIGALDFGSPSYQSWTEKTGPFGKAVKNKKIVGNMGNSAISQNRSKLTSLCDLYECWWKLGTEKDRFKVLARLKASHLFTKNKSISHPMTRKNKPITRMVLFGGFHKWGDPQKVVGS